MKVNDFLNSFSMINFSYQFLPEPKGNLEPSRTSTMELFHEKISLQIHKKIPAPESLFNKVAALYPATSLKERTSTQVFFDEFCEILKTPFLQNSSRRLLLFDRKILYQ